MIRLSATILGVLALGKFILPYKSSAYYFIVDLSLLLFFLFEQMVLLGITQAQNTLVKVEWLSKLNRSEMKMSGPCLSEKGKPARAGHGSHGFMISRVLLKFNIGN